jgi:hypothetical protein
MSDTFADSRWYRQAGILLALGSVPSLAQAVVPMEEFIHRGDDAFYYFKIAINYPAHGFWTFDGIHPTNGVQPLWAVLLTIVAQALAWAGVTDPDTPARTFVGIAALLHVASCLLLYHVLARTVSVATGVAAAGALLLPMGITWTRTWGMENGLYALMLVSTVAWVHFRLRMDPRPRTVVITGALLGFTALSRLNAGFLTPCVLLWILASADFGAMRARVRLAVIAGAAASLVILPYLAWNIATTGHVLPVSGAVKAIETEHWLASSGIQEVPSRQFFSVVFSGWRLPIEDFVSARLLDGLWAFGVRLVSDESRSARWALGSLVALLLLPSVAGPKAWLALLRERARRLRPFGYVLAFAVLNSAISILLYPTEMYSVLKWWLAETEIVLVTLAATVAAAALGFLVQSRFARPVALRIATVGLAAMVIAHATTALLFYFDGTKQKRTWTRSWNDESYRAARWINATLPAGTVVGSWNAGVLGYYAERPVVNLDGLINGFALLPFLRDRRIAEYIRREGIQYLSDMEGKFHQVGIAADLPLTEVYRHFTSEGRAYRIYRVDPGAAP